MLSSTMDTQNKSKRSSPPKVLLEKFKKRLAEKESQENQVLLKFTKLVTTEQVKKQNEKSNDNRDTSMYQSPLREVSRMQVSNLSESQKRMQLTKKSIMQEMLFKSICESTQNQKKPLIKKSVVNESFQNNKKQDNKLKKKNCDRSKNKIKSEKLNLPNKSSTLSKNSLESSGYTSSTDQQISKNLQITETVNRFFQSYSTPQNNGSKIKDNTLNNIPDPSSSSGNNLKSSISKCNIVTHNLTIRQESIEKIAATKDEATKEFLNFVDKTTDSRIVFRKYNNLTGLKNIDSPLLKIKRSISDRSVKNLKVTAQIIKNFQLSQLKPTSIDIIDSMDFSIEQSPSTDNLIAQTKSADKENFSELILNQEQGKIVEKSKDVDFSNIVKKKEIIKYDDDMFNFTKESKCNLNTAAKPRVDFSNTVPKKKVIEYDDDMFNFEKHNIIASMKDNRSAATNSSTKELNIEPQKYLLKLKELHEKHLNSSIDSDDFSSNCTSEIDDLSALRGSTSSKFEAVTNKIDSYKFYHDDKVKQKNNESNEEKNKNKISIKEKKLNTIPIEIKEKLAIDNPNVECDLDSGLGLKTSNSTKTDSSVTIGVEGYSEENCIIFHKHSDVPSSAIIQEINPSSKTDLVGEGSIIPAYMSNLEDINSDEEFDIVNVEEFGPCIDFINELKGVAAAQKAMTIDRINKEDTKAIRNLEENNNEINTEIIKSSESAKLIIQRNEPNVNEYHLDDCDNTPKMCNPTTTGNGVSKRTHKIKNALQKYQKKFKSKDIGEGNIVEEIQQKQQKPIDALEDHSLRTRLIIPRHQILKEIMKQNLHLQCKPILVQNMK